MKYVILFFICLALLTGCDKTETGPQGVPGEKGDTGAPGSTAKGSISGKIRQFNTAGIQYTTTLNSTTVSISNTSLSSVTDAQGNYTITDVPPGTYELHVRKPNCGLVRVQQVLCPGNGNLVINSAITEKADYEFSGGYLKDTMIANSKFLYYNVTFSVSPGPRNMAMLLSESADIDPEDPRTYAISIIVGPVFSPASNGVNLTNIYPKDIFRSGSTVYAKLYPCSNGGSYTDREAVFSKQVNPTCGKPLGSAISFVFP